MHIHSHVKRIKWLFTGVIGFLGFLIIFGIFLVRSERALSFPVIRNAFSYAQYAFEASSNNGNSLLANVSSVFTQEQAGAVGEQQSAAQAIPVLLYHGISEKTDRFTITPQNFKDHLFALKQAGYQTVTLKEYISFTRGERMLPERSFVLTFDDGIRSSYFEADPVLKALGYNAVMFIATNFSLPEEFRKEGYYLSHRELAAMEESGRWDIQSHAVQEDGGFVPLDGGEHTGTFLSNKKWIASESRLETDDEFAQRVTRELAYSKERIEDQLDKQVVALAFPFGDYGQQTINNPAARQLIEKVVRDTYEVAFRQTWPHDGEFSYNYPNGGGDAYHLRIEPHPSWPAEKLLAVLEQGEAKQLPYEDRFESDRGWRRLWGEVTVQNMLRTNSHGTTQGSFALLDGTRSWTDYDMNVSLSRNRGSHITLVARYRDSNNYVACTYSPSYVRLEEYIDGERRLKDEYRFSSENNDQDLNLTMAVEDRFASCYIGDLRAARTDSLSDAASFGGIGIKTWDQQPDNTRVEVRHLLVEETGTETNLNAATAQKEE